MDEDFFSSRDISWKIECPTSKIKSKLNPMSLQGTKVPTKNFALRHHSVFAIVGFISAKALYQEMEIPLAFGKKFKPKKNSLHDLTKNFLQPWILNCFVLINQSHFFTYQNLEHKLYITFKTVFLSLFTGFMNNLGEGFEERTLLHWFENLSNVFFPSVLLSCFIFHQKRFLLRSFKNYKYLLR